MQLSNDASNTYNVLPLMRDLPTHTQRNQGKQAHPVLKYRVAHGSHSNKHTHRPKFAWVR